mmetsp:Transcript_76894/g.220135  ORF Transcript_76894/g.220135 Transcript_76894/m.220135 type:complete len:233 (-) Transcript_76894:216-914(-)
MQRSTIKQQGIEEYNVVEAPCIEAQLVVGIGQAWVALVAVVVAAGIETKVLVASSRHPRAASGVLGDRDRARIVGHCRSCATTAATNGEPDVVNVARHATRRVGGGVRRRELWHIGTTEDEPALVDDEPCEGTVFHRCVARQHATSRARGVVDHGGSAFHRDGQTVQWCQRLDALRGRQCIQLHSTGNELVKEIVARIDPLVVQAIVASSLDQCGRVFLACDLAIPPHGDVL